MFKDEILDVIDENNNVVGQVRKDIAYKKQISHRVIHVMVVNGNRVFLPRRSMKVSYCPGFYCSSAGGHVQSGESSLEAALRELKEEIGLEGPLELVEEFFFVHEFRVHVTLFVKRYDFSQDLICLDPEEVLSGEFYSLSEIDNLDNKKFHPQLQTCLEKVSLYLQGGGS